MQSIECIADFADINKIEGVEIDLIYGYTSIFRQKNLRHTIEMTAFFHEKKNQRKSNSSWVRYLIQAIAMHRIRGIQRNRFLKSFGKLIDPNEEDLANGIDENIQHFGWRQFCILIVFRAFAKYAHWSKVLMNAWGKDAVSTRRKNFHKTKEKIFHCSATKHLIGIDCSHLSFFFVFFFVCSVSA